MRAVCWANGDHLQANASPRLTEFALELDRRRAAGRGTRAEDWAGWWRAVRDDAELHDAVAERDRRGVDHPERSERSPEVHEAALRAAGFRGIEVLWRKGHRHGARGAELSATR